MQLDIQGTAVAGHAEVRRHVEQRALFELARYGGHIGEVRVRVTERLTETAPPFHCGIAVTVLHDDGANRQVLSREEGPDVFRLIEMVLARAAFLVGGELERARAAQAARAEWEAMAVANLLSSGR